jgi:hypothetical protein
MRCTGKAATTTALVVDFFSRLSQPTTIMSLAWLGKQRFTWLDTLSAPRPADYKNLFCQYNVLLVPPRWNFSPLPWRLFPLHDWSFLKQSKQWSIHRCHVDFHILADVCHSPPLGRVIVSVLICMLRETLSSKSLQASANLPYRLNEMSPYAEASVWYWTHQRSHYLTLTCVLILCIPMAWVIVSDWKWVCVLRYISIPFHIYKQNQ